MRKNLIKLYLTLLSIVSAVTAPVTAGRIFMAWFHVRREIIKRGEVAPLITLTFMGAKSLGGAAAVPMPMAGRMLVFFEPRALSKLSYHEIKFVVAHECGHCIGQKNKAMFVPYLTPAGLMLGGGMAGRAEEVEADLVAGQLLNLTGNQILAYRMTVHTVCLKMMAASLLGMTQEEVELTIYSQTEGVRDALGL